MGVWYGHYYELKMQIPDHEYHIYVDDTLRLTACITNFQKDSIWTTYFPTGEIQSVISYKTGKRNGESLEFYKSGSLLRKGTYVNDCPINGIVTTYYESGGIQAKFYYDHCTYIRQEVYDEHGKIEFIYDPKTGTTITK